MIPGVLYGRGKTPHAICVSERELRRVLTGPSGLHAILDVVLEGQKTTHASILKDYQQDVITGRIAHIDLQEVRLDQPIQAQVVIELIGESAGTKEGGVLSQVTREINVEALPMPANRNTPHMNSTNGVKSPIVDGLAYPATRMANTVAPMPDTIVTFAPPTRSEMGPATMRASEPTSGPRNAYLSGSGAFAKSPYWFLISTGKAAARPENVPKVIM